MLDIVYLIREQKKVPFLKQILLTNVLRYVNINTTNKENKL